MSLNPFYNSPGWIRARAAALRRDRHLCQECLKRRRFVTATTVHHIRHLKDRPDLALNLDNLVSLCEGCHNQAHPEKRQKRSRRKLPDHMRIYKL